jgi:hypothetical protein
MMRKAQGRALAAQMVSKDSHDLAAHTPGALSTSCTFTRILRYSFLSVVIRFCRKDFLPACG